MFNGLSNIIRIDLSYFNTSLVTNMSRMFKDCNSLISLNLNNFNTSLVTNVRSMFNGCSSLISINLNNFNTSLITNLRGMFYDYSSLISLNLDNFDTSLVTNMSRMFKDCNSLISLNLNNFNSSLVTDIINIFYNFNSSFIYCINEKIEINLTSLLSNFVNDCNNTCFVNVDHKLIKEKRKCINNCYDDDECKYEYNIICYETCPNGTHNSSINNYLCELDDQIISDCDIKCKNCSLKSNINNLCISCNIENNFYPKYNDSSNNDSFINCYNNKLEGYYLDINNKIYKKCYPSCKNCLEYGDKNDNKCIECYSNYILNKNNCYYSNDCEKVNKNLIKEKNKCIDYCYNDDKYLYQYNNICYNLCPEGTTISSNNKYLCEKECPNDKPYENKFNNECTKQCNSIELFNSECKIKNNNIKIKDETIKNIKIEILNGNLDELIIKLLNNDKEYLIIENNDTKYEITTTDNQNNNNKYLNISIIRLGECENELKKYYDIDEKESLIIFKIDKYEESVLIPIVEYEVYDFKNRKQLDLNICNNKNIEILYPAIIDENNEFKHNLSSEYYNDICYIYTTENETDITLADRKKEFNDNNMSLCEANCEYNGYDSDVKKSKCKCQIKINLQLMSDVINNIKLNNFINIKNDTNIKIIKCFKELFIKDGLKKNIGNFILLSIILSNIICLIVFIIKEFKLLNDIMDKNILKNKDISNKEGKKIKKSRKKNNSNPKKYKNIKRKKYINNLKTNEENINNKSSSFEHIMNKIKKMEGIGNILNDFEINSLKYKEALKFDKRRYFEYYFSLLKRKQILIFTFYTNNDYNSKSIKICLLLFSFALYYTINALFFNDSTMHKIYIDKGKYDFIYQLSNILYSTLICSIINTLIKYLSLTETNIINMKRNKGEKEKNMKIKKCLTIKFILFFLLNFIFLILFWYYISCFCAIYKNTQMHLIKDTLISFGLSLLYPVGLCLLPGIFRIPSLRDSKQDKQCIYNLSKIIEICI